ncbi:mitochondrial processing peptidase [Angomonas deanei]|uniref:Insulinase (Peptidase family M16), putative n=1 Tax=Angomonas deanei TaxID=59799 RepID=A0A7G2CRR1_9TRYP|nr:mitochondrial processing peptidase [Angomonas deanei]CAD2220872.1 Insulinase (Peptidase family M16), putative [Angomonas deanei]|eukprot:EPY42453.1 mitochondrial processing peptidase [Angomonas deanei]
MENSLFQLDRTMRSTGSAYGHGEVAKEFLVWKAECRRDMWEKPFDMLATSVVIPRFHETDVERFRDTMDNQLEELRWQQPREYVVDQLETIAFYKEPLGSPRMVPPKVNDRCNQKALLDQWASLFHPKNITIAAVNVPHDALVAAYERLPYKHSAEAPHHARSTPSTVSSANEAAQFYPGRHAVEHESRAGVMGTKPDMDPEVIAAIGVVTNGREDVKKYAASLVAREVVSSALHPATVPNYWGAQSFYRPYGTAGLIGYTIRCAPSKIESEISKAAAAFPATVDDAAVARGKSRAALRVASEQLEQARDYLDFISTSSHSAEELMGAINGVSKADIDGVLKAVVGQKPAIFATGDSHTFPVVAALNKP